jgi:alpha-mannosidase
MGLEAQFFDRITNE